MREGTCDQSTTISWRKRLGMLTKLWIELLDVLIDWLSSLTRVPRQKIIQAKTYAKC